MKLDKTLTTSDSDTLVDRRTLLRMGALAGASVMAGAAFGLGGQGLSPQSHSINHRILSAAATAEALATVMYYNIITTVGGIYTNGLAGNGPDRAYLVAGYEEELNHFNFLLEAGAEPLATTFYFPSGMFIDPQVTVNTLVTLEDAFVAAYLIGVRDLTSDSLKVIAAQIMGVEAEHRALGRVITADLGLISVSGLAGPEMVDPPSFTANNLAYERTFRDALPDIRHVVAALGPFVSPGATGFDPTPYTFAAASTPPSAPPVLLQGLTPALTVHV